MDEMTMNAIPAVAGAGSFPAPGSAAWKAEQLAQGNIRIETSGSSPGAAVIAAPAHKTIRLSIGGLLRGARWLRLGIALLVVAGGGGLRAFSGSDGPDTSAAFVPLSSYTYGPASVEASAELEQFVNSVPGGEDLVTGVEVRPVLENGVPVAVFNVTGLSGDFGGDPLGAAFDMAGMDVGTGFSEGPSGETLNYWLVTVGTAHEVVWWDDDGFIMSVVGLDEDKIGDIGREIGLANVNCADREPPRIPGQDPPRLLEPC
jgi:hypothetical protein